jgi:hypothetical protein
MLNKIEDFLMNRFGGKLLARLALVITSYLVGPLASLVLAKTGVALHLDQAEVNTAIMGALLAAFEWLKAKRAANPVSVTVQTDLSKLPPAAPAL